MNHYERVCASVDLDAILANARALYRNIDENIKLMAVVKSDGYGHGALPIAKKLQDEDFIYGFATATAEEALILRKSGIGKPILILGYTFPYAYEELIREDISLTVFREDMAEELSEIAVSLGKEALIHVKVDTGMHRIGIAPEDGGESFMEKVLSLPGLKLEGIFTHLATADETDKKNAYGQVESFKTFIKTVEEKHGISIPFKHCFNSAAIMEMKESSMNLARAGIALYGISPSDEMQQDGVVLKPALSLHSHIVYIKTLPAGSPVSYGGTFVTEKETKVATVPVGYGDGYPRGLSNCGYVLLHGKKAPILGRVCMDQFMIDVTDLEEVHTGDKVTLIGKDGEEEITVESLCDLYGGFRYEMICDIGKRVPKEYYEGDKMVYAKDYHNDLK